MNFKNVGKILLIIVLLVFPALLLWTYNKPVQRLNLFDRIVLRITSPIQGAISKMGRGIWGLGSHYIVLSNASKENDNLIRENGLLKIKVARVEDIINRNIELERLLKWKEPLSNRGIDLRGGNVIAVYQQPYPGLPRLLINIGEKDGVKLHMGVIAPKDKGIVIGRIVEVQPSYSLVASTLEPGLEPSVEIATVGATGRLEVSKTSANRYEFTADVSSSDRLIQLNDEVVTIGRADLMGTAGSENRGLLNYLFPRHLHIGKVSKITITGTSVRKIEVEPAIDMRAVKEVFVIVGDSPVKIEPVRKIPKKTTPTPKPAEPISP